MVMASSQAFPSDEHPAAHSSQPSTSHSTQISSEQEFNIRNVDSLKFVMQIIITLFMLGMCWRGLQIKDDSTRALYWGGLTGIIGWWMPSPGGFRSAPDLKK